MACVTAVGLAVTSPAVAQPKKKPAAKTAKGGAKKSDKSDKKAGGDKAAKSDAKDGAKTDEPPKKGGRGEKATPGDKKDTKADVVDVKTDKKDDAIKTYKFGNVDIEGRQRAPHIIYFLRRVRAEFGAGDLGHRSFFRELSDTRRHSAFR